MSEKEKLCYVKHCVFHPFDGFYEAKNRGKGSLGIATALLILYCVLRCVQVQYTGFIMNTNHVSRMSSITIFISALSVLLLFVLSNWTVTTLFEGKGKLKDIYLVLCYSLVPMILMDTIVVFVSNYVIEEEVILLTSLQAMGVVWFCFMMVAGLCTVHEYGLAKNLVTLLVTAAAAAIILFLAVLFLSLMEQMVDFADVFVKEWIRRVS